MSEGLELFHMKRDVLRLLLESGFIDDDEADLTERRINLAVNKGLLGEVNRSAPSSRFGRYRLSRRNIRKFCVIHRLWDIGLNVCDRTDCLTEQLDLISRTPLPTDVKMRMGKAESVLSLPMSGMHGY